MKSKFIFTAMVLIALYVQSYGQIHLQFLNESETKDFNEIVQAVEAYFADKDKGEGSGYPEFKQWEHYNANRLSSDGKVVNVRQRNFETFYYDGYGLPGANKRSPGGDWESVGPDGYSPVANGDTGGVGRINCVTLDPDNSNIIYIGSPSGGLWRSVDGGSSWSALTDGIPRIGVSGIAIDPTSPQNDRTIYILTGDKDGDDNPSVGVLKSPDNGETWYSTALAGEILGKPHKIIHHPSNNNTVYVAAGNGLFRTTDGGLEWFHEITNEYVYDIEFKPGPGNANIMYASTAIDIYRSENGGANWVEEFTHPGATRIELAVTPANPDYVYALCGGNPGLAQFNGLYRSTDSGLNYSLQSSSPNILGYQVNGGGTNDYSLNSLAIAVSAADAENVVVGSRNCWRSTNGGATWSITSYWDEGEILDMNVTQSYVHSYVHDLKIDGNTNTLYCASSGGVYSSTTYAGPIGSVSWSNMSNGLRITQIQRLGTGMAGAGLSPKIAYGAWDTGYNVMDPDNPADNEHWEEQGGNGFETAVGQGDLIFGTSANGVTIHVLDYIDPLKNIHPITRPDHTDNGAWLTPFVVVPQAGLNKLVIGYNNIWKRENIHQGNLGGGGWTQISYNNDDLDPVNENIMHLAVAPSNDLYIYAAKGNQMYRTINEGFDNWSNITNKLPTAAGATLPYFVVHPTDPNTVYTVIGGYNAGDKVYWTANGGASWSNISGSLPNVPVNCIVYDADSNNNGLYVGMDIGVFYRDDDTGDWIPFYHNMPNVEVTELEINNGKLYAATNGRGIWQTDLYGRECLTTVDITEDQGGFKHYSADNITAESTILPFSQVSYVAESAVTLNPGFYTDTGFSAFNAYIDPFVCADGFVKFNTDKRGYYLGPLPGIIGVVPPDPVKRSLELEVFPNPAQDLVYILYDLEEEENVVITVYDLNGKRVLREEKGMKKAGRHVDKINIGGLFKATYIITLTAGQTRFESEKVIKQ